MIDFSKVIKQRSSDNNFFVHFWTPICKIGGVLFWRRDIFPPKMVLFYNRSFLKLFHLIIWYAIFYKVYQKYIENFDV